MCYEMRLAAISESEQKQSESAWGVEWDYELANHQQLNGMLQHLEQTMVDIGFLDPNTPKQTMSRLRRLFQRAGVDTMEINILRGIFSAVQRQQRNQHAPQDVVDNGDSD